MAIKPTYRLRFYKALAALMLFLLVSLEGLQALHRHSCGEDPGHSQETEFSSAEVKCQVCEYFAHRHPEPAGHPVLDEPNLPLTQRAAQNEFQLVALRELIVERSSNKGPPASC